MGGLIIGLPVLNFCAGIVMVVVGLARSDREVVVLGLVVAAFHLWVAWFLCGDFLMQAVRELRERR